MTKEELQAMVDRDETVKQWVTLTMNMPKHLLPESEKFEIVLTVIDRLEAKESQG